MGTAPPMEAVLPHLHPRAPPLPLAVAWPPGVLLACQASGLPWAGPLTTQGKAGTIWGPAIPRWPLRGTLRWVPLSGVLPLLGRTLVPTLVGTTLPLWRPTARVGGAL